jgi:hypothetical protein
MEDKLMQKHLAKIRKISGDVYKRNLKAVSFISNVLKVENLGEMTDKHFRGKEMGFFSWSEIEMLNDLDISGVGYSSSLLCMVFLTSDKAYCFKNNTLRFGFQKVVDFLRSKIEPSMQETILEKLSEG